LGLDTQSPFTVQGPEDTVHAGTAGNKVVAMLVVVFVVVVDGRATAATPSAV